MPDNQHEFYANDEEVLEELRRFESCELAPDDFKHRTHLTVALCYLLRASDADALEQMRRSLGRYIKTHNITPMLYHETITVFWLRRVRAFIERAGAGRTLKWLANALPEACSDKRLVQEYFSKELIDSEIARNAWVEPDLRPLDF